MEEVDKEKEKLLQNSKYGSTEEIRKKTLEQASLTSHVLNLLGCIIGVLSYFDVFVDWLVLLAWFYLAAIVIYSFWYKGLIVIGPTNKESPYESHFLGLFIGAMWLMFLSFDFNIIDYSYALYLTLIFSAIIMILVFFATKELKGESAIYKIVNVFSVSLSLGCFVFGLIISYNCIYDSSEKAVAYYETVVVNKYNTGGKDSQDILSVNPWGDEKEENDVLVDKETFDKVNAGDTVGIYVENGAFGIHWYHAVH